MRVAIAAALAAFVLSATLAAFALSPPEDAPDPVELLTAASTPAPAPASALVVQGAQRPAWAPGFAWDVVFNDDFPCTIAVARTDGGIHRQGVACEGEEIAAAQIAAYDMPYLGRFDEDLAGVTGEGRTRWFDWPLRDGKTWRTEYDGIDVEVRASYVPDVDGPAGDEPGFELEMREEEGDRFVRYTYVPSIAWWGEIEFESGYRIEVVGFRPDFEGEALLASSAMRFSTNFTTGVGSPLSEFEGEEDDDALLLLHSVQGFNMHRLQVRTPGGEVAYQSESYGDSGFRFALLDGEPGTWQVENVRVGVGVVRVAVHGIAYERLDLDAGLSG